MTLPSHLTGSSELVSANPSHEVVCISSPSSADSESVCNTYSVIYFSLTHFLYPVCLVT